MNVSLPLFVVFIAMLAMLAWKAPRWLFVIWPLALLVFPSTRTNLGPAPVYWYDAVSVLILCRVYFSGDLQQWPSQVPRWHWWFVVVGAVMGTLLPIVRYGASAEMVWILGHASLAWMAFPIGIALFVGPHAERYRACAAFGILVSLAITAGIATLQFGNEGMAARINSFYFRDMQGHLVLAEEIGAALSSARVNGPHGDPNTFGGTTAIACAIYLLLLEGKSRRLALASIALAAVVVGATVSRQVLVAAVIASFVAFMLGTSRVRMQVVMAGSLLVVIGVASGVAASWGERLGKWEGGVGEDLNVVGRVIIGPMRLMSLIGQDPTVLLTGVGLDVQKLVRKVADSAEQVGMLQTGFVSNSFLLPLYYLGIAGFVLMLTFWIWTLLRSLEQPREVRALYVGCVVAAMVLIAADNYAFIVEVSAAMLSVLAAAACARRPGTAHAGLQSMAPQRSGFDQSLPRPRYENLIP